MPHKKVSLKAGASPEKAAGADEILTVSMLARYLHCHPSTVYRLLKLRQIPAFKIGGDWRFQRSVIERWLKKSTIHSAAD
jgi:excisionase family DNA binding protein